MRALVAALMVAGLLAGAAPAAGAPRPVDLDVLFVGAHPDDEAFGLAVYGAWGEELGVRTGVVTITRGEGGGNAAGPEEGPPLGLLREAEERRAVAPRRHRGRLLPRRGRLLLHGLRAAHARGVGGPLDARACRARRAGDPPGDHRDHGPGAHARQPRPPPDRGAAGRRGVRGGRGPVGLPLADHGRGARPVARQAPVPRRRGRRVRRRHRAGVRADLHAGGAARTRRSACGPARGRPTGRRGRRPPARPSASTSPRAGAASRTSPRTRGASAATASPRSPRGCPTARAARTATRCSRARCPGARRPAAGHRAPALPGGVRRRAGRNGRAHRPGARPAAARARARAACDLPDGWTGAATARLGRLGPNRDATATLRLACPARCVSRPRPRPRHAARGRPRRAAARRWCGSSRRSGGRSSRCRRSPTSAPGPPRARVAAARRPRQPGRGAGRGGDADAADRPAQRRDAARTPARSRCGSPAGFAADALSKPFDAIPPGGRSSVTFEVTNTDPTLRDRPCRAATTRSTS